MIKVTKDSRGIHIFLDRARVPAKKTADIVLERVTEHVWKRRVKEYIDMGYSQTEAEQKVRMDGTHPVLKGQKPGPREGGRPQPLMARGSYDAKVIDNRKARDARDADSTRAGFEANIKKAMEAGNKKLAEQLIKAMAEADRRGTLDAVKGTKDCACQHKTKDSDKEADELFKQFEQNKITRAELFTKLKKLGWSVEDIRAQLDG